MIDPSKDKLAYFKDNIQTAEDQEEFDASQYYYHRNDSANLNSSHASSTRTPIKMSENLSMSAPGDGTINKNLARSMDEASDPSVPLGSFSRYSRPDSLYQTPRSGYPQPDIQGKDIDGLDKNQRVGISNFPALESRIAGMSLAGDGNDFALRRPQGIRFPGQEQEEFMIQKEDFPALSSSNVEKASAGPNSQVRGNKQDALTSHSTEPTIEEGQQYGLQGLLKVIRMTSKDLNTLSIGTDLTALGLNLNSSECLYSTFASPWADGPSSKEPQYTLPLCYYMQPPALKTSHLSKFQLETLFYIFYAMPKDVLQAYAAQELYAREWYYHGDLKLWFKRASQSDGINNPPATHGIQYIYFDINAWERRLFAGNIHGGIEPGLLKEEEVRVKFAPSN